MLCPSSIALLLLAFLPYLTPAQAAPTDIPSAASFYVPSLPDITWDPVNPLTIYAGHLPADPNAASASPTDVTPHLYFVMVKNRRIADKKRVIFWFNGGPGCSSFDGLMMEVGPWRWNGPGKIGFTAKDGGWEEYATVVYVDQPAGTGFSYTSTDKYVHTMEEASAQLIVFLRNFYQVFPEYQNQDTYFAGESFAGQWIPYHAAAVLNAKHLPTRLRGVAIGNGWIDPKSHYPSYLDFAVKVGVLEENSADWKEAKRLTDICVEEMESVGGRPMQYSNKCSRLLLDVLKVREKQVNGVNMCANIYDIRLDDESPACGMNWPPEIHPITDYLDRPDVVRALHADAHPGSWIECRNDVQRALNERKLNSSFTVLPQVLEKIEVLIFAGDQDVICNYVGLENMIKQLEWNGGLGLGTVQTQSWSVNGMPAGTWVSSRNLSYVKIFNASHMAPFDAPHASHDMMLRFMGVNFTTLVDGSARIPSSVGTDVKPVFVGEEPGATSPVPPAKTPEQDKAMWEAYYNAGSAALVLLIIFLIVGGVVWCRIRRNRVRLPIRREDGGSDGGEERIPLASAMHRQNGTSTSALAGMRSADDFNERQGGENGFGKGKGKQQQEVDEEPIFDVGDSDDEDYKGGGK